MLSAIEKRMSSLLTKSAIGTEVMSWSRYVPGCSSVLFTEPTHSKLPQPFLSIICLLLAERHVDQSSIFSLDGLEGKPMLVEVVEVFLGVCGCARTQTLSLFSWIR